MPWLDDTVPSNASAKKWKTVISNALSRRISADKMASNFRELSFRYPLASQGVAGVLLSFRDPDIGADDQLLFRYTQVLLLLKAVSPAHILMALLNTSRFKRQQTELQSPEIPGTGLPTCEERMFNMLTQMYVSGDIVLRPSGAQDVVYALAVWMRAVSSYEIEKQLEGSTLHTVDAFSFGMYEALASLIITLLNSNDFREAAKKPWWKERRSTVIEKIQSFVNQLLWMQSPLSGRLQAITTMPPFLETDAKGRPIFSNEQILSSVTELPTETSRAGLFVWLSACLCAKPLTDDMSMLTYLQARYPGNNQTPVIDLLIAAFDVLTNALLPPKSDHQVHIIRSFICNKLPHLFGVMANFMTSAATIEACISMAFMAITMDALPPISTGANEVREKLKLTRLEFLQACAIHGLVSESSISTIIQEPATALPRVSKYTKEALLTQCNNNIGRLETLIDELDSMVGNAGAISGCIVDTINTLCISKDSISLKSVCNMLIKKISSVDIILQYTQPENLLMPLCDQLNGWTHDQDQTEFTPAYEEFASILLFVLSVVHRYGLRRSDLGRPELGLMDSDSFIARLLQDIAVSKSPSELSQEQSKQLGKWVDGLYSTDETGEMGGISDEVMRHCPPQAFYQLVPTLFSQSVLARKSGDLLVKTFNGGLELLVEPFLLPSLVGGLSWLVQHSWEDHGDANILLAVLDKLLKPSSSSQETKSMHKAILDIVADPLYHSLEVLHQRQPEKKQVNPLMNILKPHLNRRQTLEVTKMEITAAGDLASHLRTTVRDLISWVTNIGPTPPPKFSYRIFAYTSAVLGSNAVRDVLVAELKDQTAIGHGGIALEICSSFICAPTSSSVRESLRLRCASVQKLLHERVGEAEALVRLHRRVESQLAVSQMPQLPMNISMPDATTDQVMAELGLTDAAAGLAVGGTAAAEMSNMELDVLDQAIKDVGGAGGDQTMLDLTGAGGAGTNAFEGLDMGLGQEQQMMDADGSGGNAEEDIFAGLDMSLGDDFNFS